jgi:hypothetical protein
MHVVRLAVGQSSVLWQLGSVVEPEPEEDEEGATGEGSTEVQR